MKTLLIYGDSFGEETMHNHSMREKTLQFRTFHSDLRDSGTFDKVIVYARAASDLWSQYKLFKQTFTGDEHVLWFETDPVRFCSPDDSNFTNVVSTLVKLESSTDSHMREKLSAAINYWKYLQDVPYVNFIHQAMLEDIQSSCPHLMILPCFVNSHSFVDNCMAGVSVKEITYWELNNTEFINGTSKLVDLRRNHMTETNHSILGSMLIDYYRTGSPIDFSKFQNPVHESKEKYFI
jgi:hypothetical protein